MPWQKSMFAVVAAAIACTAEASLQSASLVVSGDDAAGVEATFEPRFEGAGTLFENVQVNRLGTTGSSGTISAGTSVRSYLFEVQGNGGQSNNYELSLQFQSTILGVAFRNNRLNSSRTALLNSGFDSMLVLPAGGELDRPSERNSVTIGLDTLSVSGRVGGGFDSFRVFVALPPATVPGMIPEPASAFCWAGLLGLAAARRRC